MVEQNLKGRASLPKMSKFKSLGSIKAYLNTIILNRFTSIPILLCCFSSGLVDANVFNSWSVFASMQTGNTIILALGASQRPIGQPHAWLQAMTAILFFFLGAFVTSRVFGMLLAPPLRRSSLSASFAIQAGLIATAAALVQGSVVPGLRLEPAAAERGITLVPLAMLAFQAGQQCVAARELGLGEVPTTVLTSAYCDLANDHLLFAPLQDNWKRNRRFASAVCLLLGAITGGWLSHTNIGMAASLWFAAGLKASLSIAWLLWRPDNTHIEKV